MLLTSALQFVSIYSPEIAVDLNVLLERVKSASSSIEFSDVINCVDANYACAPTAFRNGELNNAAGENVGSCKVFAFAMKHGLDEQQTLRCFGSYYRDDVLGKPDGEDHQNIRNFMKTGWAGIAFSSDALKPK